MRRKKLVIISHTEHYSNQNNEIVGWGATINEINYLADYWEEVIHVGCLYDSEVPKSALPYTKANVFFSPIPPYGGKTIKSKLLIVTKIPKVIKQVKIAIKGATEVQLRLPTSMGLFLLPLFAFIWTRNFVFWVKYAGNWNQEGAPLSYRLQKWFLQKNFANCKVTINGFWVNQPKNCLSFENPCLTNEAIEKGTAVAAIKNFEAPFVFCFVGRLDENKGMQHIVTAFKEIPLDKIKEVHFIGDGVGKDLYKKQLSFLEDQVVFHGFLAQCEVHTLLAKSHFILLPSQSEGFPKVIAEAACYGVIPIVSNVGSVPHYINESNGFVWDLNGSVKYQDLVQSALTSNPYHLKEKSNAVKNLAKKFTFTSYFEKLKGLILN